MFNLRSNLSRTKPQPTSLKFNLKHKDVAMVAAVVGTKTSTVIETNAEESTMTTPAITSETPTAS